MNATLKVDLLEFLVLAEYAEIQDLPTVVTYLHYLGPEIDLTFEQLEAAELRCYERELIDEAGEVSDEVWDLMAVYDQTTLEYDLRFSEEKGSELRACVSCANQLALRTVTDGTHVELFELFPEEAVSSLVALLPDVAPANIKPGLSMNLAELEAATDGLTKDDDPSIVEQRLRSQGADLSAFREINELFDAPTLGTGQLGLTMWGEQYGVRGERIVQLVDVERGRIALYNKDGERKIAGADMATFQQALDDIENDTRAIQASL